MENEIRIAGVYTIADKNEERFLRRKTRPFDFSAHSKKEVHALIRDMREIMRASHGIGLSANQVGIPYQCFVVQVPDAQGNLKFYAVFNPSIVKTKGEKQFLEEGCLSVPNKYGLVERYPQLVLVGFDRNGKPLKLKAWGLLAHVIQHEMDHLNGILFTDKTELLHEKPASERLRQREKDLGIAQ